MKYDKQSRKLLNLKDYQIKHLIRNVRVVGSIPIASSIKSKAWRSSLNRM
jgi:hypothetical protein